MAASLCATQALYHRGLMRDIGQEQRDPTVLWLDNKAAIDLSHDPLTHGLAMHIERRHLKVRELQAKGEVTVHKVHTDDNYADLFTKVLDRPRFEKLRAWVMNIKGLGYSG